MTIEFTPRQLHADQLKPGQVFRGRRDGEMVVVIVATSAGCQYYINLSTGQLYLSTVVFGDIQLFPNAKVVCEP